MDKIKAYKLPGFYTDERGAYGIVINTTILLLILTGRAMTSQLTP